MNYLDFPHHIITIDDYLTDEEWDTWLDEQKNAPLDTENLRTSSNTSQHNSKHANHS